MQKAKTLRKPKRTRKFGGRRYEWRGKVYISKRDANAYAKRHRAKGTGHHARRVTLSGRRHVVYVNPCHHSHWYYIHRARQKPTKKGIAAARRRATIEQKEYVKGYQEYLERGY